MTGNIACCKQNPSSYKGGFYMKTQLFNQNTITIIPQTSDDTACFINEKYMNTLFTGISDKNARAFIVTLYGAHKTE